MRGNGQSNLFAMRSYTLEGIVIKRQNFGEADRIITFFTKEEGKVSLIARSIRKITSRRAGSLELFNLVKFSAVKGKGNLDVLTEVNLINSFPGWKKHIGRISLAYQLCETVDKLTSENQPHTRLFTLLENSLNNISGLDADWKEQFNHWLVLLVQYLGFLPEDRPFTGDINRFIEEIAERPIYSRKLLKNLSR
jgi:DNA repair protein RecO (recombination protein O)